MVKDIYHIIRFLLTVLTEGFITVRDFISDVRYEFKKRR